MGPGAASARIALVFCASDPLGLPVVVPVLLHTLMDLCAAGVCYLFLLSTLVFAACIERIVPRAVQLERLSWVRSSQSGYDDVHTVDVIIARLTLWQRVHILILPRPSRRNRLVQPSEVLQSKIQAHSVRAGAVLYMYVGSVSAPSICSRDPGLLRLALRDH